MEYLLLIIALVILAETTYTVVATSSRSKKVARQSVYVDTSVLIDGRILAIAEAGFVPGELVIPRSVLRELQLLADGGDSDKRAKARKGLDLVRKLQAIDQVSVRIMQDGVAERGVDEQLIELAKKYHGSVCTVDYNLNKVAQVEGVQVLNINELAKNIRAVHMPGESATIELVTRGQDSHQGVGYLEDGTMVVVEQAAKQVGSKVEVEFIRVLQTDAGKMMFARLAGSKPGKPSKSDSQPVKKLIQRKSGGRKPEQQKQLSTPVEAPVVTPTPTSSQKSKPTMHTETKPPRTSGRRPSQRRSSKPKSGEDSLISLIDKQ
ncbi:hypothetical protein GII36_03490 [Candidatus Mycosynbacter amalyticus]|uniref:PIN domain-containing protein n=1 Tax=Candidatus Mycosynbacter amalyticus TaxID=2665156 RepID=A0A857MP78_9BACT|nr:hypothetical protein [Candidatus Mycosynbacter amalyticus]QHN42901.1 hypothetical protein GII36_03490 [Candidatus Mycosynbacter amalyticus]